MVGDRKQISNAPAPIERISGRSTLATPEPTPELHPLPFDGQHWSPWQVLAWIISRDRVMVEHMASSGHSPSTKWKEIDWPDKARVAKEHGAKNVALDFNSALAAMAYAAETQDVLASGCPWYEGKASIRCKIDEKLWGTEIKLADSNLQTSGYEWTKVWFDRRSVLRHWPVTQTKSKVASESTIDKTIEAIYDDAEVSGQKPPNVREIARPVQQRLSAAGFKATGRHIQKIAGAAKHKQRRRKTGPTLANERLRQS